MNARRHLGIRHWPGRAGIVLGLIAAAVFALARTAPALTESIYGRGIYPHIARFLARLTGWIPFSLAEWVFALVVVSMLLAPLRGWRAAREAGHGIFRSLAGALVSTLGRAGTWWFWFTLLWGLNYARPMPLKPFGVGPRPDQEQTSQLVKDVAARVDAVRANVAEDPTGVARTPDDLAALDAHLRTLQADVLKDAGLPPVDRGRVKKFLASPLILRWGVSGVYGPFTGEPNVVWPAAPTMLPFVLAHERAHLSGFADEETASFIALLTCWRSNRPEVRYSAWLSLYIEFRANPKDRTPAVKRDITALAAFVEKHRGREAPVMWKAYSGYLKAHGVKGGVKSYGRVADVALQWLASHGMPNEPEP